MIFPKLKFQPGMRVVSGFENIRGIKFRPNQEEKRGGKIDTHQAIWLWLKIQVLSKETAWERNLQKVYQSLKLQEKGHFNSQNRGAAGGLNI